MRRLELFEIHDHPLFPPFLRNLCTDALEALWSFSNSYKPILLRLHHALAKTQTKEVLDLCSGGGGPWLQLIRDMEVEQHYPVNVCLTDKYPNREAFEKAWFKSKSKIRSDARSISATEVPVDLSGFRTIFSSFHHFQPEAASQILTNAVNCGKGIGIFETACRRPKTCLAICFLPFLMWFVTPQIRPFRWSRLFWTYVLPVVPFVLCFDGWMSCLRTYSHAELSEMVEKIPGDNYQWELGMEGNGFLPVTYLIGYPKNSISSR